MKADIRIYNIVVEVDVAGVDYPLELKDMDFICADEEYDSPEEFEELIDKLTDELTQELGYAILSCEYDYTEKE